MGYGFQGQGQNTRRRLAAVLLAWSSASSFGAVVFDRSPDTTGAVTLIENFLNVDNAPLAQWYAERFTLDATTAIDGIDIRTSRR
jgi:hypothetical protein